MRPRAPISVVTTGGTIASRDHGRGAAPHPDALAVPAAVRTRAVLAKDSSALTMADLDAIRRAVHAELAAGAPAVVLTHGTDTMEETALALDLVHVDPRPVVLTGAIRGADHPDPDGPRNLDDALVVAASPAARGLGVLLVLAGVVHAARGTRKRHTDRPHPLRDPRDGPVGLVSTGGLRVIRNPRRPAPLSIADLADVRVDVVALYPGADAVAIDACVAAGARGVVLEATGSGNTNPVVVSAVARHVAAGVVVLVTSRVDSGPVRPVYGGGGGAVDLHAAGALVVPWLRAGQARILLSTLLAAAASADTIRQHVQEEQ
ncbi:MAG: asparaginase [Mycobacteriaceae bacterium]